MSKITFKEATKAFEIVRDEKPYDVRTNQECRDHINALTVLFMYLAQTEKALTRYRVKNALGYAGKMLDFDPIRTVKDAKMYKRPQDIKAALMLREKAQREMSKHLKYSDVDYYTKCQSIFVLCKSLTKEELSLYIPEDYVVEIIIESEIIQEISVREFYLIY